MSSPARRLSQLARRGSAAEVEAVVKSLVDARGMDAVAKDITSCDFGERNSKSALLDAAFRGNTKILRVLLNAGAEVNVPDDAGNTALHQAAVKGNARAAYVLLEAGANPEQGNAFGSTAAKKAEINNWDSDAVKEGKEFIMRMLASGIGGVQYDELPVDECATPKTPKWKPPPSPATFAANFVTFNRAEGSAPQQGQSADDDDLFKLPDRPRLDTYQFDGCDSTTVCTEQEKGTMSRRRVMLSDLVMQGDMVAIEARLNEALMMGGRDAAIREVSNCEQDNQDSRIVYSALHAAALKGDLKIMKRLLETNASVNLINDAGDTPLHLATRQAEKPRELIGYLLAQGADRDAMNNFGKTPQLSPILPF